MPLTSKDSIQTQPRKYQSLCRRCPLRKRCTKPCKKLKADLASIASMSNEAFATDEEVENLVYPDDIDDGLNAHERHAVIAEAMTTLSPMQRQVVELSIKRDLAPPVVATTLGISLNTVYSHLRDAAIKLRAAISDVSFTDLCGRLDASGRPLYMRGEFSNLPAPRPPGSAPYPSNFLRKIKEHRMGGERPEFRTNQAPGRATVKPTENLFSHQIAESGMDGQTTAKSTSSPPPNIKCRACGSPKLWVIASKIYCPICHAIGQDVGGAHV